MGRPAALFDPNGIRNTSQYQYHIPPENHGSKAWKGPRKVVRFCLLAVLLPCVLVSVALLCRFVVHGVATYHLSPSDMRILDQRISTIWCQSEVVKSNTTFTAYLTNGEPEVIKDLEPVIVERRIIIPDDHKEYWGFYLLQGSTFRVYTCARFRGGTLLIVRGRNHLEHCAYIGESDSAGTSDEFSSSNSRETGPDINGNGTEPSSKEEMGALLSKIRQYVRSRPKNYGKLKQNLANWMLIEQEMENATSSPSPLPLSSLLLENSSPSPSETPNVEHGKLLRKRRSIEIRKGSESGENGAFEVTDDDDEDGKNSNAIIEKEVQKKRLGHSIWSQEHEDEHGILNQHVDPNDGSNSESESSWSSSEEAMAKCEGVVATFNLKANETCELEHESVSFLDSEPFYEGHVNASGYYYFIFGSENEKRDNNIRILFQLEKFVYHLPPPVPHCTNVKECAVNFTFASNGKLVITVPQPPVNLESGWNNNYVAESDCLPRTSLYMIFVILVPLVILLCAFQ